MSRQMTTPKTVILFILLIVHGSAFLLPNSPPFGRPLPKKSMQILPSQQHGGTVKTKTTSKQPVEASLTRCSLSISSTVFGSSKINTIATNKRSLVSFFPNALLSRSKAQHLSSTATTTPTTSSTTSCTQLKAGMGGTLYCRPIGVGSAAPHTVITNSDLEAVVETTDEWIVTRTGISQRRVLLQSEPLVDLSVQACRRALEMASCDATDVNMIICATSSADDLFGDAPRIAAALGCTTNTLAFDLTAACSGFLFATVTAGKFLSNYVPPGTTAAEQQQSQRQRILVVGADALSRWVDWDDRGSCILFGDGAGAMLLESCSAAPPPASDSDSDDDDNNSSLPGILGYAAHSNGHGHCDLNLPYEGEPRHVATPGEGVTLSRGSYRQIGMNGREVYKFATREVPHALEEALEQAKMTVDDVDWLLLHQANIRIIDIVADRLGIDKSKIITNLSEYGNTSAASIPIALDEAVRSGQVKKGDVIACAGFGAGLSWGAAVLRWG